VSQTLNIDNTNGMTEFGKDKCAEQDVTNAIKTVTSEKVEDKWPISISQIPKSFSSGVKWLNCTGNNSPSPHTKV
jgi:hypothetical protein